MEQFLMSLFSSGSILQYTPTDIDNLIIDSFNSGKPLEETIPDKLHSTLDEWLKKYKQSCLEKLLGQLKKPQTARQLWLNDNNEKVLLRQATTECNKKFRCAKFDRALCDQSTGSYNFELNNKLKDDWQRIKKSDVNTFINIKNMAKSNDEKDLYDMFIEIHGQRVYDKMRQEFVDNYVKREKVVSTTIDECWSELSTEELAKYADRESVDKQRYDIMCARVTTHVEKCFTPGFEKL